MASETKTTANRANAKRSTGPKTAKGKAMAKLNAVAHGLRSVVPVIPGERAEDWDAHRAGTVAALAPAGTLETELAERVALLTWRLRRVVTYETAVTADRIREAEARARGEEDTADHPLAALPSYRALAPRTYAAVRKELDAARANATSFEQFRDRFLALPGLPADHPLDGGEAFTLLREATGYTPGGDEAAMDIEDHDFLAAVGVPEEWRDEPDWWDGWTAGLVRNGLKVIAEADGLTGEGLTDRAAREAARVAVAERRKVARLEDELAGLAGAAADAERRARSRGALPGADALDKVMRYEGHLARQLTQTLHLLERLQAARGGNPPPPPAAVDVTVEAGGVNFTPAG
jgi:hypothetical protein